MSMILRTLLQGAGIRDVMEARDAATAFEMLRECPPDLALVDYQLGDLDGLEFARLVRTAKDSTTPYLPIILITAHAERSRVKEAIDAGVNEFIVKPVSTKALLNRVRSVIERPRPFIKAGGYFGPDRRRRQDPAYNGPWRRADDAAKKDAQGG
jgi:two-component system chemotaxis response regulator CheY